MSHLLDTNAISEGTKRQPNAGLQNWLAAQSNESLFLSVITLGEIRRGILMLQDGKKKRELQRWLEEDVKMVFSGRILPIDSMVMECWAQLQANAVQTGRQLPVMDSLLAATALAHNLTIVTRNTSDFESVDVHLLNPWLP